MKYLYIFGMILIGPIMMLICLGRYYYGEISSAEYDYVSILANDHNTHPSQKELIHQTIKDGKITEWEYARIKEQGVIVTKNRIKNNIGD